MTTKIRLVPGDAALVFRKDGLVDAFFPRPYPPGLDEARNVMFAQALFWAYNDDRMMTAIVEAIRAEPNRIN